MASPFARCPAVSLPDSGHSVLGHRSIQRALGLWIHLANGDKDGGVYDRLGQLEREVAGISPQLKQLSEDLHGLKQAGSQPTNWIGVGSLVIAILLYMNTTQDPIKSNLAALDSDLKSLAGELSTRAALVYEAPNRFRNLEVSVDRFETWLGALSVSRNELQKGLASAQSDIRNQYEQDKTFESQMDIERARNADIEERVSRQEGMLQVLTKQVEHIDLKGSRKWNQKQ